MIRRKLFLCNVLNCDGLDIDLEELLWAPLTRMYELNFESLIKVIKQLDDWRFLVEFAALAPNPAPLCAKLNFAEIEDVYVVFGIFIGLILNDVAEVEEALLTRLYSEIVKKTKNVIGTRICLTLQTLKAIQRPENSFLKGRAA